MAQLKRGRRRLLLTCGEKGNRLDNMDKYITRAGWENRITGTGWGRQRNPKKKKLGFKAHDD